MADLWIRLGTAGAVIAAGLALGAPVPAPHAAPAQRSAVRIALPPALTLDQKTAIASLTEGRRAQLVASGETARTRNARIALSHAPMETMRAFTASGPSSAAAQTCLTQAIYYEAGHEPESGKRAVAQVVLNRVRHPAYPASVCGVVYQGADRQVCQFSFTCDGSLSRRPATAAWAEAGRIAREALSGKVEESVGSATHYHADYVVPRWAYSLGKVRQIGTHIFYRFNGGLGRARAFTQLYAGAEHLPDVSGPVRVAGGPDPVTGHFENGLTVAPSTSDRHAPADIGGRLDTTKGWKLTLPTGSAGHYRQLVSGKITPDDQSAEPQTAAAQVEPAA